MHAAFAVSFALGAIAVVQAGLNRRIAAVWGLGPAIFLNGVIVALLGGGFLFASLRGWVAGLGPNPTLGALRWYWVFPGVMGFTLIAGLPWAVARIGSLHVFVAAVAAQMVFSGLWDVFVEGVPMNWGRAAGATLAVAGAWLVARS